MASSEIRGSSTTEALPVAPSMGPALQSVQVPYDVAPVGQRVVFMSGLAIFIGIVGGFIAEILMRLIWLITNLSFYGRFSFEQVNPSVTHIGLGVLLVPVIGAVIVGFMAKYGSKAIRGHGIPEVMEKVLWGKSRIPARLMFWKPLSAAVAIGTGGPFGAEGPIIATGGAFGSFVGQIISVTADERKTLLAAGAAAGMAATFGSPVSAVLLAVELLLFEYRPRSIIPVALASSAATAVRFILMGLAPIFAMPDLAEVTGAAVASYVVLGALVGVASVFVTKAVYAIEDGFEKLPIHWMWWPVLGAIVVGIIGYIEPRTLGVGYYNIEEIVSGDILGRALFFLVLLKFVSWAVYLSSGTSGGTLAPLFTIGGGLGALIGSIAGGWFPALGIEAGLAGLVGMAAMFAGASQAFLTSVIFAFETTRQPMVLLPLLAGCGAAYLASLLMMRSSIMTEKLARRGAPIRTEYDVDFLTQITAREVGIREVVTLNGTDRLEDVRRWFTSEEGGTRHHGFPVLDQAGELIGVVTRWNVIDPKQPGDRLVRDVVKRTPVVVFDDNTLREAADHMVRERVGRVPVVSRADPLKVIGIITRSDLLLAHQSRLEATDHSGPTLRQRLERQAKMPKNGRKRIKSKKG
ncbi:MAG TPA: chloride channel protein [Rhodothermales bacterium]|nr:chloride channel protein [Rhodothermales bacterium]